MKSLPYKRKFIITQTFLNPSDLYESGYHLAVDLVGLEDKTVYAIQDGRIVYVGYNQSFGNTVVVHQKDKLYCRYSHLESIRIKNNQNVTSGKTVIGIEGSTGNVVGEKDPRHLDLRISKKPNHTNIVNDYKDPGRYLGFPNQLNYVVNPGGLQMSKIKNVILSKNQIDERAAGYLADHLNCKIIEIDLLPASVLDEVFENIYVIGSLTKPVPKAVAIYGNDRYDTCQKVLDMISEARR